MCFKDVFFDDFYVIECHRDQAVQEIIVVATHINYFSTEVLHHFHDNLKEISMFCLPPLSTRLTQMPTIYNVSVQYQTVTTDRFQKVTDLNCFGMRGSQMDIRQNHCRIIRS